MTPGSACGHPDRPRVSILLPAYRQQDVVADAVRAALAQTYSPLQIVMSDDASDDGTFAAIERSVAGYTGPHDVVVRRNAVNEGITAHLSRLAAIADGELLFVAAGDDVSEPERCDRVVAHWLARDRRPDLIATDLLDIDRSGRLHGRIDHSDLDALALQDWLTARPWLVGASHTWTRRLFDRFGPMRAGAHAEDQIMLLRALFGGGASTLHEPLVRWRRGGLSAKRRHADLNALLAHMRRGNRAGLAEIAQLLADAQVAGRSGAVRAALGPRLAREQFVERMLEAPSAIERWRAVVHAGDVPLDYRLRLLGYTTIPWLYDPMLRIKAGARLSRHGDAAGRPAE